MADHDPDWAKKRLLKWFSIVPGEGDRDTEALVQQADQSCLDERPYCAGLDHFDCWLENPLRGVCPYLRGVR